MPDELKISVEPQNVESGYLIWHISQLEASVTVSPEKYESRKLVATFEQSSPIRVAVPLVPGMPQPENTVILQNITDQGQLMIQQLKAALDEAIKSETPPPTDTTW